MEHKSIALNGMNYHINDSMDGDHTVLLLHGMPDTAAVWDHQTRALVETGYRVIAPDMLGYGRTDKPQAVDRYQGEALIADMIGLLDALAIRQVDIVGHDWGAFMSWELVLNFPERFNRHVTLSVGHPDVMMSMTSQQEVRNSWYMYLNALRHAAELYAANECEFFRRFIIPSHPDPAEVCARMNDPEAMNGMLNWDRANPMTSLYLATVTSDAPPRKCSVPTLGLWSSGDTYLWEDQIKNSGALMDADWRYELIDNASHWLQLDQAEQVSTLIIEWLSAGRS